MDRVARIIPKKKMLFFMVAASAVTFSFSSCKLGEKYARPELNLPTELEAGADSLSVDNIPWESLYADTTLQRLITTALENNKDMKIAAAKIKEMIAAKRITFADQFP